MKTTNLTEATEDDGKIKDAKSICSVLDCKAVKVCQLTVY